MGFKIPKFYYYASAVGTVFGGGILLKDYIGGQPYSGKETLEGQTIIVTGSNCGIGKETAKELAARGARVIMACKNLERCKRARREIILETKNRHVVCRLCDLSSFSSIRQFAETIVREEPIINGLVNNAGIMRCPRGTTKEGIELQLGVNHMGHFLLTNLLLQKLKECSPTRITIVSSIAHRRGTINFEDLNSDKKYDPAEAYNQSKLANILFSNELAERLKGTGVTVVSVHPGIVNSDIMRYTALYKSSLSGIFLRPFLSFFLKSPKHGSYAVVRAALDQNIPSGSYLNVSKVEDPAEQALSKEDAQRLWKISEKWTRIS